ncbi:uncharacterized protein LOC143027820 [Oratosquilla oratoria]|uniref:uncharacterized protein LOC143027820 n=1 Tax=Oratosquilla oratoria TaxID=337810 RepID=UPI003F75C7BF
MNILVTTSSKQLLEVAACARNQFVKRKFRVLSVKLYPRGVLRVNLEKLESGKADNKVYKEDKFQYKKKTSTRNIESVDPIVLKYTQFLSDLKAPNVEQRYITRFGAIRFDEENVPKVHGQYEENLGSSESAEELGEKFEAPQLAEKGEETGHLNYVDEYYFGQAIEGLVIDNKAVGVTNTKDIEMTQFGGDLTENNTSNEKEISENFIDEIYFGNNLDCSVSSVTSDLGAQNSKRLDKKDIGNDELFHPSLKSDECKNKESLSVNDWSKEASDMNFIDNHYFSESLINRGSNIKSNEYDSEKYKNIHESKIQKDLINEETVANEIDIGKSNYSLQTSLKNTTDYKTKSRTHKINEGVDFVEEVEKKNLDRENSQTLKSQQEQRTAVDAKAEKFGSVKTQSLLSKDDTILESNDTMVPEFDKPVDIENPKSAYDYVRKLRKEHYLQEENEKEVRRDDSPVKTYKKLLKLQFQINRFTRSEMVHYLKKSILYDNYDIIGLYKPFGLPVQQGTGQHEFTLTDLLPDLGKLLKVEKIHVVHRLDIGTTGVILLSRSESMANTLRKMFHDHKVVKTYWAITKGVPHPTQGLIDIPMEEGMVDGKRRMVLRPNIEGMHTGSNRHSAQIALTKYKVLSRGTNCALVEVQPVTGIKHQIRAHLGFGLACPVIGDHKYSHLKKFAPQRLPGDLLQCLKIPQSRVRDLPIFLHARSVLLPEVVEGRNILIKAAAPAMFSKALGIMKISKRKGD